jgi:hypothetical protein
VNIPNEAIEAARSLLPIELRIYVGRVEMRAYLEAAAPFIAAAAWDDAYGKGFEAARGEPDSTNPYRSQA